MPKKSIFTKEEQEFILVHADRGKILTETGFFYLSSFKSLNVTRIHFKGESKIILPPSKLRFKYQKEYNESQNKLKNELIKAISECDEIDFDDDMITTYKSRPESDDVLLCRIEQGGRIAFETIKNDYINQIKSESRQVLFEKIQRPKKRLAKMKTARIVRVENEDNELEILTNLLLQKMNRLFPI